MGTINQITIDSKNYPPLLKNIKDPPEKLYYRGDITIALNRCFGVVGARKPTEYGKWAAYKTGQRLGENGITVVSGMAAGIDSQSHRGALAAGGRTIAVLGCGVDICIPEGNRNLMEEIGERGLILSEYPPGYPGAKYTFPRRNRIISGLCEGVVVVEAGLNSGSLITAELAGEQGRSVYAIPGNITSPMSIGTNKLLRDGATPVSVLDDILSDMGVATEPSPIIMNNLGIDEKKLLKLIGERGEVTVEFLCGNSGMTPGKVNGILTILEMKGIICTALGKIFIAK